MKLKDEETFPDEETADEIQLITNIQISLEDELTVLLQAPIHTPARVDRFKKLLREFSLSIDKQLKAIA